MGEPVPNALLKTWMLLFAVPVITKLGVSDNLLGLTGETDTITGAGNPTPNEKLQVCPPTETGNIAGPELLGVPVIVNIRFPFPFTNVPAVMVAVKPSTPVEGITCESYCPPFPPVYEILLLTPVADIPAVNVPVLTAPAQLREVIAAGQIPPVVQVSIPLQIVRICPLLPGFSRIHSVPFQYII
jgi:hypothetical protein